MRKNKCKKGLGTKDNPPCIHIYNGECIRKEGTPCLRNLGLKKKKQNGNTEKIL